MRRYSTVIKSSSNTTWNCDEICPVLGLRTRATFDACDGDQPM
jgi:hypothetical protein